MYTRSPLTVTGRDEHENVWISMATSDIICDMCEGVATSFRKKGRYCPEMHSHAPMHVTCDVTICHGNLDASMLSCACHSRRRPSMNFYPSSCLPSPLCLAWPHPCRTLQIDIVPFSSNRLLIPKQTPLDLSLDMPVILCHTVSAYSIYI